MTPAKRLAAIAELAESIAGTCEELADTWDTWDDTEGFTRDEKTEHREDIEERIDELAGEVMAEARKMQALHPLYVSAEDQ